MYNRCKSIYSPLGTTGSTWILTNFELHCDYIQSNVYLPTLTPVLFSISVTDYSQRLNTLLSATTGQIRWGRAYSLLDKVYTILRDGTTSQDLPTKLALQNQALKLCATMFLATMFDCLKTTCSAVAQLLMRAMKRLRILHKHHYIFS